MYCERQTSLLTFIRLCFCLFFSLTVVAYMKFCVEDLSATVQVTTFILVYPWLIIRKHTSFLACLFLFLVRYCFFVVVVIKLCHKFVSSWLFFLSVHSCIYVVYVTVVSGTFVLADIHIVLKTKWHLKFCF